MSSVLTIDEIAKKSKWHTTIGAICDRFGGEVQTGPFGSQLHASDYVDDGIPVVMPQDMVEGIISSDRIARASPDDVKRLKQHLLRKGDIVYSRRGDVSRFAVVTDEEEGWLCGTGSIRIRLNCPDIDIAYARQFLKQDTVRNWLLHQAKGVTMPNLNTSIILAQSIFIEMFGDPVSNAKGWPSNLTLGEIADIVSGITKGRKLNGHSVRTIPYMAVLNVQDRRLNFDVVKEIEATDAEIDRYRLQRDDLLLTEGGDPDKLGRGTLWNDELPECIHQNHVFRVRLQSKEIAPLFLNWLVGSRRGKNYFLRSAKQTTGIASINMTQLRGFPLLVPPIQLQNEFAKRIAGLETLRSLSAQGMIGLEHLFSSLQHRAFLGEL